MEEYRKKKLQEIDEKINKLLAKNENTKQIRDKIAKLTLLKHMHGLRSD
jgi:hypothetical protein